MTDNEAEVLGNMGEGWHRPMDVGGSLLGSHIAKLLRRMSLHANGWVEAQARSPGRMERGSYEYRITAKGTQALANHREATRVGKRIGEAERARGARIVKGLTNAQG